MNIKVIYHSRTGNTKKIAEAIGQAVNSTPEVAADFVPLTDEPIDLLFIGDGIYAGKPDKSISKLIEKLDSNVVKNAAVFATYGGQSSIGNTIKTLLTDKGINVIGEPFTCKGKAWALMNRKHPSNDDLNNAKEFATSIMEKGEKAIFK